MDVNKLLNPVDSRARVAEYNLGQTYYRLESDPSRTENFSIQQKLYGRPGLVPFTSGTAFTALHNLSHTSIAGRPVPDVFTKVPRLDHLSNLQTTGYLGRLQGGRNLSASSASSTDSLDSSITLHNNNAHYGRSLSYDHSYSVQYGSVPSVGPASPTPSQLSAPTVLSPMAESFNGGSSVADPNDITGPPKCSYCVDCQTKSPLRKVVSHIFGRNKAETRAIPKNVWVYYCRKHYQRSRYRNPKGFAVLQCELVRRQIARLQAWDGVQSWSVKVRQPKAGKKPEASPLADGSNEDADSEIAEESQGLETADSGSTAEGREWLTRYEGENRTMEEIKLLIEDIERNVDMSGGTFPDVELLPHCYPNSPEEGHDEDAWMKESHRRKNGPRGSSGRKVKNRGGALAALETKQKRKAASEAPHMQMDGIGMMKKPCLGDGVVETSGTPSSSRTASVEAPLKREEPSEPHLMSLEDSSQRRAMVLVHP